MTDRAGWFSSNHKTISRWYFITSIAFFLLAGLLAMVMRWQLGWPGSEIPLLGKIMPRLRDQGGIMPPEIYAEFFSQHGTLMVFFVIIPLLVGGFGNFLIPLQCGAREMSFPRMNALSLLFHVAGGLIIAAGPWLPGGAGAAGWTAYTPLSSRAEFTAGQTSWIVAIMCFCASQILGGLCHAVTIVARRASGMSWMRMPMFLWSMLATALLILFSTPALLAAIFMLLSDRTFGTNFFSASADGATGGGQPLLWQHMFWFYAHPAVYIMILPAMGTISEILPVFARKPLFGYGAFVISTWAIAGLGFLVWGHHMFQSGMSPYLATTFMGATLVIAVPSTVELTNWIATLWGGSIRFSAALWYAVGFLVTFAIGGLSGIFSASTPVNAYLHDTYFIVGHLHYVLFGGSLFGLFAAHAFWFPKMTGRMLDERAAKLHCALTVATYNMTFFPMFILGVGGMMRRIYDTTQFAHLQPLQPLNVFVTQSAFALGTTQLILAANVVLSAAGKGGALARFAMAIVAFLAGLALALPTSQALAMWLGAAPGQDPSLFVLHYPIASLAMGLVAGAGAAWYVARSSAGTGAAAPDNPWQANSLEWQISSPPSRRNFPEIPTVHRPPYDFSLPGHEPASGVAQNQPTTTVA